jgi:enolase-like protein/mandelate racemase/muconate lactonizing enzyme-like protein
MGTIRIPITQRHYSPYERPRHIQVPIERLEVSAYVIPTDGPESDGTLEWHHTVLLLVEAVAGGQSSLGYSYAGYGSAAVVKELLTEIVVGHDALSVEDCWWAMMHAVRNIGRPGAVAMAISAVDAALWDLKARLLNLPLVTLLGSVRDGVPVYGSGGFITYDLKRLTGQLGGWVEQGIPRVKMKVGQDAEEDLKRVEAVRRAIGDGPEIFIDANGGYATKEALSVADAAALQGVTWFEEPVSSDDLDGLRRASTAMTRCIFAGCCMRRPLMCFKPTPRGAVASPAFSRRPRSAMRNLFRSPPIARPPYTCTPVAPRGRCATSNISMTTSGSSRCCSTASSNRSTACCIPIDRARESAWNSNGKMLNGMRHEESWHNLLRRKN